VAAPSPRSLCASIRLDHLRNGPYFPLPTVTEEWIGKRLFIRPLVTPYRARLSTHCYGGRMIEQIADILSELVLGIIRDA